MIVWLGARGIHQVQHCANFETGLMRTWRNCQPVAKIVHKGNKDEDKLTRLVITDLNA
jgi:hypothetical protein